MPQLLGLSLQREALAAPQCLPLIVVRVSLLLHCLPLPFDTQSIATRRPPLRIKRSYSTGHTHDIPLLPPTSRAGLLIDTGGAAAPSSQTAGFKSPRRGESPEDGPGSPPPLMSPTTTKKKKSEIDDAVASYSPMPFGEAIVWALKNHSVKLMDAATLILLATFFSSIAEAPLTAITPEWLAAYNRSLAFQAAALFPYTICAISTIVYNKILAVGVLANLGLIDLMHFPPNPDHVAGASTIPPPSAPSAASAAAASAMAAAAHDGAAAASPPSPLPGGWKPKGFPNILNIEGIKPHEEPGGGICHTMSYWSSIQALAPIDCLMSDLHKGALHARGGALIPSSHRHKLAVASCISAAVEGGARIFRVGTGVGSSMVIDFFEGLLGVMHYDFDVPYLGDKTRVHIIANSLIPKHSLLEAVWDPRTGHRKDAGAAGGGGVALPWDGGAGDYIPVPFITLLLTYHMIMLRLPWIGNSLVRFHAAFFSLGGKGECTKDMLSKLFNIIKTGGWTAEGQLLFAGYILENLERDTPEDFIIVKELMDVKGVSLFDALRSLFQLRSARTHRKAAALKGVLGAPLMDIIAVEAQRRIDAWPAAKRKPTHPIKKAVAAALKDQGVDDVGGLLCLCITQRMSGERAMSL